MKMNQKHERLDYSLSQNDLDVLLHKVRYQHAHKYIVGPKVLEIGCGLGFGTKILSELNNNIKISAIDIDNNTIKFATNNNSSSNVTFQKMDATDLKFSDQTFDSIISIENIEHVDDSNKYLSEIYRTLKSGGTLFLTTPNLI